MSFRFYYGLVLLMWAPVAALAQKAASMPSFYATYQYTAYTVFDTTTDEPPTEVRGVGGTLTLRPNGSYEKHLSILAPGGPHYFNHTGRFILTGDSIRFTFTDLKGPDTQRGTFRFDPATRHFTLTIFGYPVGNKGVYELAAAQERAMPAPAAPAAKSRAKPRR